jgi:hypothetical protein
MKSSASTTNPVQDLYTRLSEPSESKVVGCEAGTYETKTIETADEQGTASLLAGLAL